MWSWLFADCSLAEALEAATLHPARLLGLEGERGTLGYGSAADLVLLDPQGGQGEGPGGLVVVATCIAGSFVWTSPAWHGADSNSENECHKY